MAVTATFNAANRNVAQTRSTAQVHVLGKRAKGLGEAAEFVPKPARNPKAGADHIGDLLARGVEVRNRVAERIQQAPSIHECIRRPIVLGKREDGIAAPTDRFRQQRLQCTHIKHRVIVQQQQVIAARLRRHPVVRRAKTDIGAWCKHLRVRIRPGQEYKRAILRSVIVHENFHFGPHLLGQHRIDAVGQQFLAIVVSDADGDGRICHRVQIRV